MKENYQQTLALTNSLAEVSRKRTMDNEIDVFKRSLRFSVSKNKEK